MEWRKFETYTRAEKASASRVVTASELNIFLFLDFREYVTTTGVNSEKKGEIRFKNEKKVDQS